MANNTGPSPVLYFVTFLILASVGYWFLSSQEQTAQITPNAAIAPQPEAPPTLGGNADLAAISRSLTPEEKAQGLAVVAIAREHSALVIGIENPYTRETR